MKIAPMPPGGVAAYYSDRVASFLSTAPYEVLGALAAAHPHALEVEQRLAWEQEIETLAAALLGITGSIYLEFDVPRLGSRIDAV